MKECKIVQINDGNHVEIQNGNFLFVEEFPKTAEIINKYLAEGYEVKHIIPQFSPASQKSDGYSFYKDGIMLYLEKETE